MSRTKPHLKTVKQAKKVFRSMVSQTARDAEKRSISREAQSFDRALPAQLEQFDRLAKRRKNAKRK